MVVSWSGSIGRAVCRRCGRGSCGSRRACFGGCGPRRAFDCGLWPCVCVQLGAVAVAGALADKTALSILDIGVNNIGTEGTYFFGGGRRVEWRAE